MILYKEIKEHYNTEYPHERTDKIYVCLRRWQDDYCRDYVLDKSVMIDGETTREMQAFGDYEDESQLIRLAISEFDRLAESHPWFCCHDD